MYWFDICIHYEMIITISLVNMLPCRIIAIYTFFMLYAAAAAAAAKSLQSCPTLWGPIDDSQPGSAVPGILQARTLEWATISFSNAWKWKVKVKLLNHVWLFATPWTAAYQAPPSMGFFQARVLEWGAIAFSFIPLRVWLRYSISLSRYTLSNVFHVDSCDPLVCHEIYLKGHTQYFLRWIKWHGVE